MTRVWTVWGALALAVTGCGDDPANSTQSQPEASVTSHAEFQDQTQVEPQREPGVEPGTVEPLSKLTDARLQFQQQALADNVRSTPVTMLVKVNRISDSPYTEQGLKVIRYRADVVDSTDSSLTGSVEFLAYTDDDVSTEIPHEQWFVSVCRDSEGELYLPDIGFTIPFDSSLMPVFTTNKSRTASEAAKSVCPSD